MDVSGAFSEGHTGSQSHFASGPVDDFVSFSDDLARGDLFGDAGDSKFSEPGGDLTGENELQECCFASSVHSPTTVASEDLHGTRIVEQDFMVGSSGDAGSSAGSVVNFDAALNVAFNTANQDQPKQVWETGIWKYIFGNDSSGLDYGVWGPQLNRPVPALWGVEQQVLAAEPTGAMKRSRFHSCNFMDVVSFKPDVPWKDQREADLQRSINMWIAVTSKWDDSCTFSFKLGEMRNESEVFDMFAHVFSGRAPITVRKRGLAILKVCDYLEHHSLESFPMREITLYRFMCSQLAEGAPASRLQGVMQAIAFCRHVLDVSELQVVLDSKRCSGVAREVCPQERKQASPLTVAELLKLHEVVDEASDDWDAAFAGAALLCCYCRGRWGDLMRSESAFLDRDENGTPAFLETRTGRHKTMSSQMHRHQFLPMVAPVRGVHGADWATPWIQRRLGLGMKFPPEGLIMPAPGQDGEATQRPLESGECGKWLRRLLGAEEATGSSSDRRVSSHSLKCTMLSFAAKRGLSVPDRLMLGYHSSQMHMAMVYSRDGAAASLLLLEGLIDEIAKGKFKPDSTRSGRLVASPDCQPGAQSVDVKVETVLSSDDERNETLGNSDSSDSTDETGSTDSEVPADHSLNRVFAPPQPPQGFVRWQHSKLKTVHLTEPGYLKVFVCGRPVGSFHQQVVADPRFDSPVCWSCFKKASK